MGGNGECQHYYRIWGKISAAVVIHGLRRVKNTVDQTSRKPPAIRVHFAQANRSSLLAAHMTFSLQTNYKFPTKSQTGKAKCKAQDLLPVEGQKARDGRGQNDLIVRTYNRSDVSGDNLWRREKTDLVCHCCFLSLEGKTIQHSLRQITLLSKMIKPGVLGDTRSLMYLK